MRRAHAAELACPSCRAPLTAAAGEAELEEGELACASCAKRYPVVRGVPRLLGQRTVESVDERTRDAFGFEWLRYPVTTPEEDRVTFFGLTGIEPRFFERVRFRNLFLHMPSSAELAAATSERLVGARVMEAGCGMGKYVKVAAALGPRLVVGLDASASVERAWALVRHLDNALIVQGDIFRPPLRGGFDFAYSVGVLHHTGDARRAFLETARLVRPGGELAVWLYPRDRRLLPWIHELFHERLARPLTSRLPHPVLERICAHLGRLSAFKTRLRERGGAARRLCARALNLIAVGEHRDPEIAAFLNFDWYSPPHRSRHAAAELQEWFTEGGYEAPRLLPVDLSAIARKAQG